MKTLAGPLNGRIILDCSTLLPGPFVGKLLAHQGARVIKIENPHRPDGAKAMGAFYDDLNESKEIVPMDLKNDADRSAFSEMVKNAHGLIEGFRPQAKKKLRLDRESLHRINPKLVIISLVGYPEAGDLRDRAGHDLNFQALTGCLSLFNQMPALPMADLFAAYRGALAMAAELDAVARGRDGTRRVIAMTESLEEVQSVLIRQYRETGKIPEYGNNLFSGAFPCYREYQTQEGRRVAVGAIEEKFWVKVCELLGRPDLKSKGYASGDEGKKVVEEIQKTFSSQPWSHWEPLFKNADCCVEPILNYAEVYGV